MSRTAWRRYAVAALPLVPVSASAVERVPVPIEAPPAESSPPAPAPPAIAVPDWLRQLGVESWWDVVGFGPWSASLGLTFDDQQQRIKDAEGMTRRYGNKLLMEDLSIRNDSVSVIDPRLFTSSVSLGIAFQQEKQRAADQSLSERGHLVNYALDGIFLGDSPYNVSVSALRSQTTYLLPSGSTTESRVDTDSMTFHLREDSFLRQREILPYFNASVRLAHQAQRQETRSGDQTYRQDDRRDSVTVDAQNGTEHSDLNAQYQYIRFDNRVYNPGSYDSQSANLAYSLDFGPTLNRRWDSRVNYYTRHGASPASNMTTIEVNEFLALDHSVERSSNYSYQLSRQETASGAVTTQAGTAQVYQQLYGNLSASAGANASHTTLPVGTLSSAGANGNATYNHRLPWDGHFTIASGGGYSVSKTHVPGGAVGVLDAPYTAPDALGAGSRILLKDRNIVANSIVVVVLKGGARVAAILDTDYTVLVEGDRTSIVPNPASALIAAGDLLNVSYVFEVNPDSKYATTSRSASVAVDWNWIGASAAHDQSDQRSLGQGQATLLADQRRDNANVWLRGVWDTLQLRANASVVRLDSTRLAYTEHRADQYVSWQPRYNLQLNISADEYRTQFRLPEHVTTGGSARVDVQWVLGGWYMTSYVSRRLYRDTLQPHEAIDETGLRVRRSWAKLELTLNLGAQKRQRGDVNTLNGFFHFGAVRRF